MSQPNLSEEERVAVAQLIRHHIDADRHPFAPSLRPLKSALSKLDDPTAPPSQDSQSNASRRSRAALRGWWTHVLVVALIGLIFATILALLFSYLGSVISKLTVPTI